MSEKSEIGRRNFLKKTTAAAAGTLAVGRMAHAAPDNRIKVALVGCGGRGNGAANHALNTKTDIWLTAIAEVDEGQARQGREILKKQHLERVDVPDERMFIGFEGYKQAKYGAESTMMAILGRMATYSEKVVEWEDAMAMDHVLVPEVASFDDTPPVVPDADGWYPTAVPGVSEPW